VASFINPHDICYMAMDAWSRATGRPLEMPTKLVRQRQCLAEALRLPPGVSREEFFRSICPPLPKNFGIPRDEPPGVRQSDWRPFRQYVQDHWTAEDWRMHRWAYARLVELADAEIGRLLDALRQSGLENNTIVVFTSDHGEMDASHKLEHKSMPYEEATRVPLIVRYNGIQAPGRVDRAHLVSTGLDLIPTLCDLAGIATPAALKGRSVAPFVRGKGGAGATPARPLSSPLLWRECLVGENEGCRMVWTRRFMYAVYDHGQPREFFADLEHDPGEMVNLAVDANYAAIFSAHRDLLRAWYPAHGETLDPRYIVR